MKRSGFGALLLLSVVPIAWAGDVGYLEDFALAKDRAVALRQLIPGTEDYYYFHSLHFLNTEQYEKVEEFAKPWRERFGETTLYTEIRTRLALLTYERDPKKALDYVRGRLGLSFNHQREVIGVAPNVPTTLAGQLISRATLLKQSFGRWSNLQNFEDSALDWLAAGELTPERRRHLLQRLQRPDVPNLPALIVEELKSLNAASFGSYAVHRQLTLAQLEEVARLAPQVFNQTPFVHAYVSKLQPHADSAWQRDRKATLAYLTALQAFAERLSEVHNAFKAHVLYHRLAFDRAQGGYDANRFLAYLKLPRQQGYMAPVLLRRVIPHEQLADLNANFQPHTLLMPIGSDEPLVRSYLQHFLTTATGYKEYEPYIESEYLKHLFAQTKIENGLGDPEQWASLLPPELYRQIKDRIDIDFAYTNKVDFAADEPVRLDLFVKNVPTLLVKVFEINTQTVYKTTQREIDTDINLDGLVANSEKTYASTEAPVRRVAKQLEFPDLNKPGVYVIDFIGSGKSSRALIRKGRLRTLVSTGTAGQKITILDDTNKQVTDASVWLAGQHYTADKNGIITVPFSSNPGPRPLVVSRGEFASLDTFNHAPETYALTAGFYVDREALLAQRVATLLVRPTLLLNGQPVSPKLLEEAKLQLVSVDSAGVPTTLEVPNFLVFEDRESTYELRVPARLTRLSITLTAKVQNLNEARKVDVSTSTTFELNGIDGSAHIDDLHLARFGGNYVVEVLGRTGEAKPDRPVQFRFKHRDFKEPVSVTLKSDAQGRIWLGPLVDITTVNATGPDGVDHPWTLGSDQHTYRQVLHAPAGDVVRVPFMFAEANRAEVALFGVRGGNIRTDHFDALALKDGVLELRGLAAGDYDLWLKRSGERIRVRLVAGTTLANHVLGAQRHLQVADLAPVQISAVTADANEVVIRLAQASKLTRVHVFGSRYVPAYNAFARLSQVRAPELGGVVPGHADSVYLTGRNIGDEYRYVLDRRGQKKYPGNLLERPMFLLNPWAIRPTETGEQKAEGGDEFGGRGANRPALAVPTPKVAAPLIAEGGAGSTSAYSNLDFLADTSAVVVNLVPDADGVVRLPRKDVGPHNFLRVVAVDPLHTTVRSISLPESPAKFLDLRLANAFDPSKHFTLQKQVSVLTQGQPFVIADVASSRFELYDSLPKVYTLYSTLSKNAHLNEFNFILNWSTLDIKEKRTLYSKYACHELNFFLFKKDAAFFTEVVQPYLANKRDKTFLDHYLLGDDLSVYQQPWYFGRLNTVERILLAQRIKEAPSGTRRHLSDLFKLLPPNLDRQRYLFDVGVLSGGLNKNDRLGFDRAKGKLEPQRELKKAEADKAAAPAREALDMPLPDAGTPVPTAAPAAPPAPGGPMGGAGPANNAAPGRPMASRAAAVRRDGEMKDALDAPADAKQAKEMQEKRLRSEEVYRQDERKAANGRVRQLYRKLDPTMEWAENNYYHLPIQQQVASLVNVNAFWLDYANHEGKGVFLSRNLAEPSHNFTEMMFALAVLDLPFAAGKHEVKFDAARMTLTPAGPAIAFHEEVRPAAAPAGQVPILVSQNFYREGDRFRDENGERSDKFVTGEFVVHTVYGGQIVVTNPSSARQKLSVLVQLPEGSVPVSHGQFTKTVLLDLEPYRTQTIDVLFYFPLPGQFKHFPVQVAKNEQVIVAAKSVTFNVVAKPSKLDTGSWEYVSQNGTNDEVLTFLNRENVRALNLNKIAFRLKERPFFEAIVKLLHERQLFHPLTYSYSILHADVASARQFLLHAEQIVRECGGPLVSPLLTIDPIERHQYEHLEYKPLVNARAHSLGQRRQIVNNRFHHQYHQYLKALSYRATLNDAEKLAVVYYLLLQDRIDEAQTTFASVNPDKVTTKLQYDYCQAYMHFFSEEPQRAQAIAARYANHPVDRWRNSFVNISNQLDEAAGKNAAVVDGENRDQRQGQLAATAPNVEFTIEAKKVNLTWQNLDSVRINYYLMDVELLFSRNPFVQQSGNQFASIRPNLTKEIKLPAGQKQFSVPLPDELLKKNVLVEVIGAGQTRSLPYYANAMDVKLTENYGQVKVTDVNQGQPLSKVYVKVYAKLADGQVKFHKDGYTDLRGRFDYVSVNTPERQAIERFSVLVLSDERGATIREAAPPAR